MTLCKSRRSNYWNHSSEIDTLVNQDDQAAPIRSPVRGRWVFQNQGVCGQAFLSFPSPTPFLPPFCSRPIFRAARMRNTPSACWVIILPPNAFFPANLLMPLKELSWMVFWFLWDTYKKTENSGVLWLRKTKNIIIFLYFINFYWFEVTYIFPQTNIIHITDRHDTSYIFKRTPQFLLTLFCF